jgi:rhomboid protease GluP
VSLVGSADTSGPTSGPTTGPTTDADGFAIRLARHLVAGAGFRPGVVPEAAALEGAADFVLTGMDGLTFTIVCIVDRERDPAHEFGLPPAQVEAIGTACAKYSGAVNGARMSAAIKIVEVGHAPPTAGQRARLAPFRRRAFFTHCVLSAWVLDTAAKTVWTTSPFGGRLAGGASDRAFLERLLQAPGAAPGSLARPAAALAAPRPPLASWALLALLGAVFVGEQVFAVDPPSALLTPGIGTLIALGGLNRGLVEAGEGWRLVSSALLHGSVLHILFNGIALLMVGRFLEALVGRAWFLALFVLGAVGGAALSLAINDPEVVSVGASGAIMGLLGAAFVASYRLPHGPDRTGLQINLAQMLVPSLLPLAFGHDAAVGGRAEVHIDYGAHLGGALTGAVAGLALLRLWPRTQPLPRLRGLALAIALAGAAVAVSALAHVVRGYDEAALDHRLIPDDQLPRTRAEERARAHDLMQRFPGDPRAHMMEAQRLLDESRDLGGAERELRAALAEKATLARFRPVLALRAQSLLALVLAAQDRGAEARAAAAPVCAASGAEAANLVVQLQMRGLCEAAAGGDAKKAG